jgi:hypothetical protein
MHDVLPISAEVRGLRRIWTQNAAARFAKLKRAFDSKQVAAAGRDFSKASTHNRQRAWQVLSRSFEGLAWLETVRLDGVRPLAIWSAISAGSNPLFAAERELTPDEEQQAVVLHYLCAGRLPQSVRGIVLGTATWTCSVTAHALGRQIMRSPTADIDADLLLLHRTLLAAPVSSASEMIRGSFIVPTSFGGFWCSADMHIGGKSKERLFHVRARTYVGRDQIADEQIEHSARLLTPRPDEPALISTSLLPFHLKQPQTGIASAREAERNTHRSAHASRQAARPLTMRSPAAMTYSQRAPVVR